MCASRLMLLVALCGSMLALSGCGEDTTGSNVESSNVEQSNIESSNVEVSESMTQESDDPRMSRPSMPEEYRDPKRDHVRQIVADGKPLDLTFDDLKFDIEIGDLFERKLLTEEIKAMDGKKVTIGGYIRPAYKQNGLKSFIFVRDNKECCFGPQAAIFDCVLVKLKKGTTTSWKVRPVKVSGTFYLKEYELDGLILAIFRMKDAAVVN